MALKVRRVVTGHDSNGKAVVKIDEVVGDLKEGRPGAMVAPVWTTAGFPVNNDGQDDAAKRQVGTTLPGGTVLRVVEFSPGVQARNHRTDSIDYAIVMSGEIDMEMDGTTIHLKAGDVLVQRGTIHNWINTGSAPCVIAFALIDAKPVTAGGKTLNAVG
jgi:quercetin dioxygenase-like cupin family protein